MKKYLIISILVLQAGWISAATISAKIAFKGRPAFSAVAYLNDGSVLENQIVDQKDKQFTQKIFVNLKSTELIFKNSDAMDHNIYANSPKDGIKFDVGLLSPGSKTKVDAKNWKEGAVIRVGCKIHPKMKSYIAILPSSNFKIIKFKKGTKEYSVEFSDVSGPQPFHLKIPGYHPVKVDLNVGDSKTIDLIKKKKVKGTIELSYQ